MNVCKCGCNLPANNQFIRGHSNKLRIGKTIEELYGKEKAIIIKNNLKKEKQKRNVTQEQLEKERIRRTNNRERLLQYAQKWRIQHKEHSKQYRLLKRQNDIHFRLLENLRSRIGKAVERKSNKTTTLIGCTVDELKQHLQKQFKSGMSWDNYSKTGWHIDHIIPCAKFNLENNEEQRKCFHYTNLQPLWAIDNFSKNKH